MIASQVSTYVGSSMLQTVHSLVVYKQPTSISIAVDPVGKLLNDMVRCKA